MKKGSIIAVIVVVVVLAAGGYALLHRSTQPTSATTSSNNSSNAPAVNNAVLVTKTSASLGQYLAKLNGEPLYTYGGDSSGVSNCTGGCLSDWPAYVATSSTANLPSGVGTIKRSDNGDTQYTYNGMPLYTFVSDKNGQVTGDGVENFSIAKPASTSSTNTNTNTTTPPSNSSSSSNTSNNGYPY